MGILSISNPGRNTQHFFCLRERAQVNEVEQMRRVPAVPRVFSGSIFVSASLCHPDGRLILSTKVGGPIIKAQAHSSFGAVHEQAHLTLNFQPH